VAKQPVSPAELFSLIDREFHGARPPECLRCLTPLPIRSDDVPGSNWRIVKPPTCPHSCHEILSRIVKKLQVEYDLGGSPA
jgi:hypothetical protein